MKFISAALAGLGLLSIASFATASDGKSTYEATCAACHATGVANAPKLGDKAAWAPRVATGKVALVDSVKNGKGVMPPNASGAKLSDPDILAAVEFMLTAVK